MSRQQSKGLALITGASSGIGEACAEIFAENGYAVALGARRVERLEQLAARLEQRGAASVFAHALDVREESSVNAFVQAVLDRFGAVDFLINNAGLAAGLDPVVMGEDDDWRAMLDTNVYGLLRMTRRMLPAMIERNRGQIINIGSIAGFQTYANGAVYAATKHAVRAISGALRLELSGTPIRVAEVDPGMVETEFSLVRLGDEAQAKAVYQGLAPLTGRDIAECVYFAASRPAHVNIDHIIIMPTAQAAVHKVHRQPSP